MKLSLSADAVHGAYIDEAVKRALLGANPASSFGLPLSCGVVFKPSALAEGPVVLVPGGTDTMILPFLVLAYTGEILASDISANLGWLAPTPPEGEEAPPEHNEPWLSATPVLWYGGEEFGSLVTLPNASAQASGRLWPECVIGRPFVVMATTPPAREAQKRADAKAELAAAAEAEVEVPEPDLTIVTFYTAV